MRILIYGINYTPELTGIGKYTGEMAAWLAGQGHDVEVITALPYYPEWQVHQTYKGKFWHSETIDGVKVHRCPLYVPGSVTSVKRILHEFTFLAGIVPFWFLSLFDKKFDIVFSIAPPFHLGLLPLLYTRLKGGKLISHIQDLQVDAAEELGMIKNRNFLNIMFGLEKFILRNSAYVSTISNGMKKKVLRKGIDVSKTFLIPNWVDEVFLRPLPAESSLRNEFGIPLEDKVILYSGNLGEKQGLQSIIVLAECFKKQTNIHFLIVGTGGAKNSLVKMAEDANLNNVRFFPLQSYEKLPNLLATADLHLVLQKKSASDLVMPSKLTGILACGGCAIVTAVPGTSLYSVIHENNLGILTEPDSDISLIKAVENGLSQDLSFCKKNARKYAEENLGKQFILAKLENKLKEIIEPKPKFREQVSV